MEEQGALAVTLENAGDEDYYDTTLPGEPRWSLQKVSGLYPGSTPKRRLLAALHAAYPHLVIRSEHFAERDWERSWLENYRPLQVGAGLWVCPTWLQPVAPEAINLRIDPGLAFGSGTHATTRLCLAYLAETDLTGKRVIDYGCGSGILAIAALKLGASQAVGVDIDPKAVTASLENARCNAVEERFSVASPADTEPADLVIANILAGTLLELQPELCRLVKSGGVLLLCGILAHQREEVESRFRTSFRFVCRQWEEWLLLVGAR